MLTLVAVVWEEGFMHSRGMQGGDSDRHSQDKNGLACFAGRAIQALPGGSGCNKS
jgi:hypothetical protein